MPYAPGPNPGDYRFTFPFDQPGPAYGFDADPPWGDVLPYNSAHAAAGGAARAGLYRFFGRDDVPYAQTSVSLPGVTRNYASFTQAADENGLSRILVGFHFRLAVTAGRTQGEQVGTWVFDHALRPLD